MNTRIPGQIHPRKTVFSLSKDISLPSAGLLWILSNLGLTVETEGKCYLPVPFSGFIYD